MRRFRELFGDTRGNFGITIALALGPLLAVTGAAIDLTRAQMSRVELQNAVDAAALSAAKDGPGDKNAAHARARDVFDANKPDHGEVDFVRFGWSGDEVTVSARVQFETGFSQLVGLDRLKVDAKASAVAAGDPRDLEVVFAVDVTNSMAWNDNSGRAVAAIETGLERLAASHADLFVSLVPFTDRVNIGARREAWLDGPAPSDWRGCVEPREETQGGWPHLLTDRTASQLPFLASVPGQFISDLKMDRGGPACSTSEIEGPFRRPSDLADELDKGLHRIGTGRFDVGLAWAWRLLSPQWEGRWGVNGYPASPEDARKIAVLITDGHTVAYDHEVLDGRPADGRFGHNNATPLGFQNLVAVCEAMKQDGVEVVTIFLRGNDHAAEPMRECASGAHAAFDVDTFEEFTAVLEDLGGLGRNEALRLSR